MADQQATPTAQTPAAPQQGQIQVNIDYLKTTRVHICMPCYGGMLTESTFMSYIKWSNTDGAPAKCARAFGAWGRQRPSTPKSRHPFAPRP